MPEQQQESLKVYELAKELGLDSFALLDKLKSINIEVKSHMSSLGGDQVSAIKEALRKDKRGSAGASAGTVARKRTAASPASATAATPTTRKVVKKAAPAAEAAAPAPKAAKAAAAEPSDAAPKRKVIKRRSGSDDSETAAQESSQEHHETQEAEEAHASAQEEMPALEASEAEEISAPEAAAAVSAEEPFEEASAPESQEQPAAPVEAAKPAAPVAKPAAPAAKPAAAAAKPAAPVAPRKVAEEKPQPRRNLDEYTPRANAPGTKVIFRTPNNRPDRPAAKDELLDEFTSRRLKIVAAPTVPTPAAPTAPAARGPANPDMGPRPTYRTPGGPAGGVERRRSTTTPGGPAGPGAAPGSDMFQPMTSYVGREGGDDRNKRGGHGSHGGPGSNNSSRGPTPEEVRINDFRKRELVFQPKRKRLPPGKMVKRTEITEMAAHKKKIRIEDKIVVSELAQRMGEKAKDVVAKLMKMGSMVGMNQTIDFDTANLIAAEFGWEVTNVAFNEAEVLAVEDAEEDGTPRPPVITVMGHVDHGKTSLLDAIRNADVAAGEAGGITQHIGAYSVMINDAPITFLDTPGHEAFANMRSRGANLTDIVVLVVAADDSIMPQTVEAIKHAQTAGVPIIVAANKVDKPSANLEKVRNDLSMHNVLVEDWGGQIPMIGVSALKKTGIKELLEAIQLQAEFMELKANPDRAAEGVVLEARMEKGRGIVADLLVDKGTLRTGDFMVVGTAYGRVRSMMNDRGQTIKEVLPGFPAEIYGLNDVPTAGDTFNVVKTEAEAKEITNNRRQKQLDEKAAAAAPKPLTMDELIARQPVAGIKELNLIIKADVYGSAEAIKQSIEKITSSKVKSKVLSSGVGAVTENDVLMARTANALILGFNAKPDNKARDLAKRDKVDIRHYSIIYQLLDDVRAAMENLLEPIRRETPMGKAEVKQVFTVSKLGTVAGSMVADGKIQRNAFARVTRGKDTVAEGKVVSLRRFKDDVSETIKGQECGIGVENFDNYMPGDIINVFHVELVKQSL